MPDVPVVSSDSHVVEPMNLWVERLDKKLRDKAPRVVEGKGSGPVFVAPGVPDMQVASVYSAGKGGKELAAHMSRGYEAARPGGWDPAERIKDMDADGLAAEVLYTSLGFSLYGLSDVELQQACFKVYNDWMAEFGSYNPKRLYPIGLISLEDVGAGIKELERITRMGLKGAMIWSGPPADKPYHCEIYDRFFAAAQDLGMPISMHEITSKDRSKNPAVIDGSVEFLTFVNLFYIHEMQTTLCSFILGGILERFPRLKVVSVELECGWVPFYAYRMDKYHNKFATMSDNKLPLKPSDYIKRQIYFTFQFDPVGPLLADKVIGEDNFLWASDYPHTATTWPHSLKVIDEIFADIPPRAKRKMISENTTKLYNMELG